MPFETPPEPSPTRRPSSVSNLPGRGPDWPQSALSASPFDSRDPADPRGPPCRNTQWLCRNPCGLRLLAPASYTCHPGAYGLPGYSLAAKAVPPQTTPNPVTDCWQSSYSLKRPYARMKLHYTTHSWTPHHI